VSTNHRLRPPHLAARACPPRAASLISGKLRARSTEFLSSRTPHSTRQKLSSKSRIFRSLTKECAKHRKQSFSSPCVLRYMRTLSLQVPYLPHLRKTDPCMRALRVNREVNVSPEILPPVPGNSTRSTSYSAQSRPMRFPAIPQRRPRRNRASRAKIKTAFAAPEPLGYGSGLAETAGIALFIWPQRPQTL
jgi:hypothetical protein